MSELFLTVLNMSLTASYVILFVILVRQVLKKSPKFISYALWAVVAFRLIIPFSFESMFSLMPWNTNSVPIPHDIIYQQSPQINTGIETVDSFVNQSLPASTVEASVNPLQIYVSIGVYVWVLGIIVMLVYSLVSIISLKKQLKSAQFIEKNIYEARNLKTPFVLGFVSPKIYLPVGLSVTERSYILLHEQTHIHRKDHIIKILAFLILSIHWFNPLVWVAFILMSKDMELSCDERVLKEMDKDIIKPYAKSLLSLATGKYILNGSLLAFGEGNLKGRIKNVLNYKRPKFWVITMAIIFVIAIAFGLISNPHSVTLSMMWAKSLQVDDIQSIELIVQPSSEQERYKNYSSQEFAEIVNLINQSSGKFIKNPEIQVGGSQTFYITTKDGIIHRFTNNGNKYLEIDGDTFEPKYDWLSKWDYEGTSNVPQGFWERVESKVVSYGLMQLKHGEVQHTISPLSGGNIKLAEDIIMNYLVKSAAWPGIDISTLEECYLLHVTYSNGTATDYYVYLHDGRPVMQYGTEGQYSIIDDGLYEKLVGMISSSTTPTSGEEEAENTKLLLNKPADDKVCLGIYTTEQVNSESYYVIDEESQEKLIPLLDNLEKKPRTESIFKNRYYTGINIVYQGMEWQILSDGSLYHFSHNENGDTEYLSLNEELCEAALQIAAQDLGIIPFDPATIKNIKSAKLRVVFSNNKEKVYEQTINDKDKLSNIEKIFSKAKVINGGTGCPFTEGIMTLGLEGGQRIKIAMATDSCCVYFVNGIYFDYKPVEFRGKEGSGIDNSIIFDYFDKIPLTTRGKKLQSSPQQKTLQPTAPKLSLEQTIGADMVELDYASNYIVIFHDYF